MGNLLFDLFDYDAIIKECKAKYGLQKKEDNFFLIKDDILFHFWPRLKRTDGTFWLNTGICFKLLYADEICWAVYAQNTAPAFPYEWHANQPLSYRVVGLPGPEKIIRDEWIPVECETTEQLQAAIEAEIEKQLQVIEGITEKDYCTEDELSMINIYRAIRHNDYKTARRLSWRIKEAWFDKWYAKKGIPVAERPQNKTAVGECAINCYYLHKPTILKYIRRNKRKMKDNIKNGCLFDICGVMLKKRSEK